MSFFRRVEGIFFNPRHVFQNLSEKPVWVDAFIAILIMTIIFVFFITPFSQNDQLQLYKDNIKLKERIGEERFNSLIEAMEKPPGTPQYIRAIVFASIFLIASFLLQALFLNIFSRFFSTHGSYVLILALLLHANFIDKLLGNGVRLILALSKKSVVQITTSLAMFFPNLDIKSTLFAVLSQVDFFQLWTFGVLAIGLAIALKIDRKKAFFISYGFWFLKALINAGIGILGMGMIR